DTASLQQIAIGNLSPNGSAAGIWQSGAGIASDTSGNLFLTTGNGDFDVSSGGVDYGESILKLNNVSGTMTVTNYFTPHDQISANSGDFDVSSSGVMLLPDQLTPPTHLAITSSKEGVIYLVNRDNMGHFNSTNDNAIVQYLSGAIGGATSEKF